MKKKDASPSAPKLQRDRPNVLQLKGEIDLHVSPVITASLTAMIEKKPERVVIDLSDVTYIDSAGLAALIQAMQKVEGYGGRFLLAGLQETVRSIFEISRLDQVFQIFPDTDTALSATCTGLKRRTSGRVAPVRLPYNGGSRILIRPRGHSYLLDNLRNSLVAGSRLD